MDTSSNRRAFLRTAVYGSLATELGFLSQLPSVSAKEANVDPRVVKLDSGIEPTVCLLEETPREKLLEEVAGRIRKGLSYQEVLAALQLAGVRNVEPRPTVGFKFHAVMVVNSAHLSSLAGPDSDRWLPIFWALDYFKSAQAQNVRERNGWRMPPVDERNVPPARHARKALITALDKWDAGAADVAIASMVRSAGADEVMEVFWRYAPRDFRAIGHKAIFASNARRTLNVIGWHHAEPILRSLTYALMSAGDINPSQTDDPADRPGRVNAERIKEIRPKWQQGKIEPQATTDLLAALRKANAEEITRTAVEMLNKGIATQSIWDATLAGSIELLMRQPGIVALHAVTSSNALRYAFETSADEKTRQWLLLQNLSFVTLFRDEMTRRNKDLPEQPIDKLEPVDSPSKKETSAQDLFDEVSRDKLLASRKALAFLKTHADPHAIVDAARRLIFLKGTDSHDYKFSAAALEDYQNLSPAWRDRYLAGSLFWMKGTGDKTNGLVQRTKAAFKA
jgi:hypothetical protein